MGHAKETHLYDCARETVEDTLGYKSIVQLSMDVSNVSWKQTWGDYTTNVIDYDYVPPARLDDHE